MAIDPIERRLRLLDSEMEGASQAFSRQVFAQSPLVVCAIGLTAGIVIQNYTSISLPWWLTAALVSLILGIFSLLFAKTNRKKWILAGVSFLVFFCLGGARLERFYRPDDSDIRNFVSKERSPAIIRGMVISRIRHEDRDRWVFGRYVFGDPSSSFYVSLAEAKFDSGWGKAKGKVRVQVAGSVKDVAPGDEVEIYCWLDRFEGPTNPGEFDVAKYLKGRGVYIAASVKSAGGIKHINDGEQTGLYAGLIKVQQRLKIIAAGSLLGEGFWEETDQGLAAALLLGHRGKIDSNTYDAFVRTGLAHFISLSGLHMGMLAGMIWWLSRFAGLSKRWRAAVTMAIIGLYITVLEPRAPTLRAAMMCCFFCLSVLARRKSNSLNAISLSAVVLLLIRPTDVFNAGWQLSYSTVLGIILLQERIWDRLLEIGYFRFEILQSKWEENKLAHAAGRFVEYILATVSVGLAAWIGGAGVLLYHFGTVTPTACLWTPVVFPVVAVILAVGFFQIVLSMLLPTIAMGLGLIVEATSNLLASMVELIARIDHSQIVIGKVSIAIVIVYYFGLFVWRFERFRKPIVKQATVAIAICLMTVPAFIGGLSKDIARHLEITCLDVGHGQAMVVSLPNGRNFLLDAGSLTRKNCGSRIVVPFLKDKGIGDLDGVFVSHDDIDHLNGLPELLASVPAKGVYVNDGFMANAQTRSSGGYFRQWLEKNSGRLEPLEHGLKRTGSAQITAIWPDKETCLDESISDNDKSQVLSIEYAGRKVLICSDIEMLAQKKILAANPNLKVDVVIMPHHGSKSNLIENFFRKLGAEILIASCSEGRYENAHKEKTTDNYFTAVDGAITIRIERDGRLSVDGFRGKNAMRRH